MGILRWNEIEREQMNPLLARQALHGVNMTVARLEITKGAVVPLHRHVNEQITIMLEGKLRFVIDGVESIVAAGDVMVIPPDAPHLVEALEDSAVFDLFSPIRSDWLSGDDGYLRK